ncbi:hypothetical protein BKA80DRAFT_17648 [Phyllosticta citrichinensis]
MMVFASELMASFAQLVGWSFKESTVLVAVRNAILDRLLNIEQRKMLRVSGKKAQIPPGFPTARRGISIPRSQSWEKVPSDFQKRRGELAGPSTDTARADGQREGIPKAAPRGCRRGLLAASRGRRASCEQEDGEDRPERGGAHGARPRATNPTPA